MLKTLEAPRSVQVSKQNLGLWNRYLNFCEKQEPKRFMWMALSLLALTCVFIPLALLVLEGSKAFILSVSTYVILLMSNLVANLGDLKMKFIISTFILSMGIVIIAPFVIQVFI
ncbi:MAG: hypothetical protein AAF696_08005 [Bacteroidota bacterium]